jgi:hypothetical protein
VIDGARNLDAVAEDVARVVQAHLP